MAHLSLWCLEKAALESIERSPLSLDRSVERSPPSAQALDGCGSGAALEPTMGVAQLPHAVNSANASRGVRGDSAGTAPEVVVSDDVAVIGKPGQRNSPLQTPASWLPPSDPGVAHCGTSSCETAPSVQAFPSKHAQTADSGARDLDALQGTSVEASLCSFLEGGLASNGIQSVLLPTPSSILAMTSHDVPQDGTGGETDGGDASTDLPLRSTTSEGLPAFEWRQPGSSAPELFGLVGSSLAIKDTVSGLSEAADAECWKRLHEQLNSLHKNVLDFANRRCPPPALVSSNDHDDEVAEAVATASAEAASAAAAASAPTDAEKAPANPANAMQHRQPARLASAGYPQSELGLQKGPLGGFGSESVTLAKPKQPLAMSVTSLGSNETQMLPRHSHPRARSGGPSRANVLQVHSPAVVTPRSPAPPFQQHHRQGSAFGGYDTPRFMPLPHGFVTSGDRLVPPHRPSTSHHTTATATMTLAAAPITPRGQPPLTAVPWRPAVPQLPTMLGLAQPPMYAAPSPRGAVGGAAVRGPSPGGPTWHGALSPRAPPPHPGPPTLAAAKAFAPAAPAPAPVRQLSGPVGLSAPFQRGALSPRG